MFSFKSHSFVHARSFSISIVAATAALVVAASLAFATPASADDATSLEPTPAATQAALLANCLIKPGNIKAKYWKRVPSSTKQVVVVEGRSMKSYSSRVLRWEKVNGCWVRLATHDSYNGYKGWATVPWTGGMRSPIGTYRLTDAGGRLANPGTKMQYHYGPQSYGAGGYAMSRAKLQIFDYVVAVNYNRKAGTTPRANRVLTNRKSSGYWFHVRRLAPTRGCVSMDRSDMKQFAQWLDPAKKPVTIQGPKSVIYS